MSEHVLIYARISVVTEESVSIDRQLASCRKYAEARGWTVVGEYDDTGVSATRNRPEERAGWTALLKHPEPFDRVIVWKLDRLCRKVLDFHLTNEALAERGAALVGVENAIDMGSKDGRMIAGILAQFAEYEADAISDRVRASRAFLRSAGRVVGGRLPYGWTSEVRDGGRFLVQDPSKIGYVKHAAQMILDGHTVKAVCAWLDEQGAPLPPSKNRNSGGWHFSTVSGLLRNPVMWGGTLDNPGNPSKKRGPEVRRDAHGLPVVDESVAIMSPADHRRLVALLDDRERPRTHQSGTSPFFSQLIRCGHCDRLMHRNRKNGREVLVCPACAQVVATGQLRTLLSQRLLDERGDASVWTHQEVVGANSDDLAEIEHALADLSAQMITVSDEEVAALVEKIASLRQMRTEARNRPAARLWRISARTVRQDWEAAAGDDTAQRALLASQAKGITVVRGKVGRKLDKARVSITWARVPAGVPLPDGNAFLEPMEGVPAGQGQVGQIVVRLPDGSRLMTT